MPKLFIDDSTLLNVSNLDGNYRNCILSGTLSPDQNSQVVFFECLSGTSGLSSPIIDMNGISGSQVSFRNYSGGIKFINISDPNFLSTVEFVAGKFHIDSSSSAGFISVRGVASLNDTSLGTIIETGSLINAASFNNIVAAPNPTLNTRVKEVWQMHGLESGSDLKVTQTERTFADVSQSISTTGSGSSQETTITRI